MPGLTEARQEALDYAESRMVRSTVNKLFDLMRPRFKGFPDNYLVFDVETTGFHQGVDLIAQLGYVEVYGRRPVDRGSVFLDWTRHPEVDQDWLKERIEKTRGHVEESKDGQPTGKVYQVSYEKLQAGMEPSEALRRYQNLFLHARQNGHFFVAHNGYHFDGRFIEEHFSTFLAGDFKFGDYELYDSGMVEKGAQAGMGPWEGESVRDFSMRVAKTWLKGVKWSLDNHCVPKYNLGEKMEISQSQAHDASTDCLLTHALFEEHRNEAESCPR
jgi:DNA polymerase III epsilon subunit-like protein